MVNPKVLVLSLLILSLSMSLKQSDIGLNDWSLENIGQLS